MASLLLLLTMAGGVNADEVVPGLQNDAGSGRDAPDDLSDDVMILPGTVYDGMSTGPLTDLTDTYTFTGTAGQVFEGWSDGNTGCYDLLDAAGESLGNGCAYGGAPLNTGPLRATLPADGTYYFQVALLSPGVYQFAYNLDAPAPDVRVLAGGSAPPAKTAAPQPIPDDCNGDFEMVGGGGFAGESDVEQFSDDCYHMRASLNNLDTADIDVLIVPPVGPWAERDLRMTQQAVEMWDTGIHQLAAEMGLAWLDEGVNIDVVIAADGVHTDPLWDPEIVVVTANPVLAGVQGIGIDPLGYSAPCRGANPLATAADWEQVPGFQRHHDGSGSYIEQCPGGGTTCYAINLSLDVVPGAVENVLGINTFDLVAHEVGHCLTVGHVGDAGDFKSNAVPFADIMSYTSQDHYKCVSTLDVETFAITMSHFLLPTPIAANDANSGLGAPYQVQHPDSHWYASPTGLAADCPQPDSWIVPGMDSPVGSVEDDAGSGGDAPNGVSQAAPIQPGVIYDAMSLGPGTDLTDVFYLTGTAGQVFEGWSDGNTGCYTLLDANGNAIGNDCSYAGAPINTGPLVVTLPYTGDYYFEVANLAPAVYQLAYNLDAPAPSVLLLPDL